MKFGLKDLFKDVTWMQVGAGALAAATSLFLASSIGIAGSVIGAAVGSVVTTLSSALYKSFLTASNDAIKEKIVGPGAEKTTVLSTAEKTRAIGTIGAQPTRPCTDELTGEGQAGAAHRPAGTCQPTVALPPYGGARVPSHAPDEVERVKDLARRRKKQRDQPHRRRGLAGYRDNRRGGLCGRGLPGNRRGGAWLSAGAAGARRLTGTVGHRASR